MIGPSHGETAVFLRDLTRAQSNALLRVLGVERARSVEATAAAVEEACARPATPDAVLASLADDEAREFLLTHVLSARDGRVGIYELIDDHDGDDFYGRSPALGRMEDLERRGFASLTDSDFEFLPCLARALRPRALEARVGILPCDSGDAPPHAFFLAVLACVLGEQPLAMTRSGSPNVQSIRRLEKRLGGPRLLGSDLEYGACCLHALGVVHSEGDFGRTTLALDVAQGAAALAADPEDLALLCAAHVGQGSELRTLAQVRAAAVKAGGAPVTVDEIEACPRRAARGDVGGGDPREVLGTLDIVEDLRWLRALSLVQRVPGGPATRFLPRTPPAHGAGRWVVQPSFEVLVPWDAPPSAVVRLSLVADLEEADRVCRFRVTKAAVQRALLAIGPRPDRRAEILQALEAGASGPLPQNVRATLEGWLRAASPLRLVRGDVVIASDAEQRGFLGRAAPGADEVAPGVFLLARDALDGMIRRARKEGVPIEARPHSSSVAWRPAPRAIDAAAAAKRVRATLDDMREPPRPPPRKRDPQKPRLERVSRRVDDEDVEDAEDENDVAARFEPARDLTPALPFPTPARPPPPPPSPPPPATWRSVLPGMLRDLLQGAIAFRLPVGLLCAKPGGAPSEIAVVPRSLRSDGLDDYLVASDKATGREVSIALDSITAVRPAGGQEDGP